MKALLKEIKLIFNCFFFPRRKFDLSSYEKIAEAVVYMIRCEIIKLGFLFIMSFCSLITYLILFDIDKISIYDYGIYAIYFAGFVYLLLEEDYYLARKKALLRGFKDLFSNADASESFWSRGLEKKEVTDVLNLLLKGYLEPKHREFYDNLFKTVLK